jgi:hypothetical protein
MRIVWKSFEDGSCLKKFKRQKLSEKVFMIIFFLKVYIIGIVWKRLHDGNCLKKFTRQKLSENVFMIRLFLKVYMIAIVWKGLLDYVDCINELIEKDNLQ